MAYSTELEEPATPRVMDDAAVNELFHPLPFGILDPGTAGTDPGTSLNPDEAAEVAARRRLWDIASPAGNNAAGLALSGGGIRSATFGLGVVQVLADKGLLQDIDFLSTVSGGGYTGSFISSHLGRGAQLTEFAFPRGPDTAAIRYLRHSARYLMAGSLWDKWGMVCATVAGTLLNWLIPLLVLVVGAAITSGHPQLNGASANPGWRGVLFATALLVAIGTLVYFNLRTGSLLRKWVGSALAMLAAISLLGVAAFLIDRSFDAIFRFPDHSAWATPESLWEAIAKKSDGIQASWALTALAGAASMAVPVVLRFVPWLRRPKVRVVVLKVALIGCGLFLPLLALLVHYLLRAFGGIARVTDGFGPFGADGFSGWELLVGVAVVLAGVSFFLININLTGPHQLYRNGLARTFVKREGDASDLVPLTGLNPTGRAPYHLINAAVNLPTSSQPGLSERKCDFFLFSKHRCGSPAVGYQATTEWRMNRQSADLATAMAISGAAFSPHMGLGSMPPLTALLTFLNVRLGFWIRRPHCFSWSGFRPGFSCLLREMTGTALSEKRAWLNLSDGGHIENLAVYELLRRRCKFIVCVDGEADPDFTFHGLMTLVRHAQIDFGIRIEPDLDPIRPDPATGRSRCHYQLCRIHYPPRGGQPAGTGLLLYLKLSVTGNESELIRRYRTNHPQFPHQSTLDQFFDQEQFEAYRQLGVHVASGLFLPALTAGNTSPPSLAEWFRSLAKNLLLP